MILLKQGKLSLKNRLWLFQVITVLIVLACNLIIVNNSGIIADLSENPYYTVRDDLDRIENELSKKCFSISNNTVELANKLNKSIQKQLDAKNTTPSQLKNNPELIDEILSAEVEKACFAMEKSGVSGVFVFLNATVNPSLERARDSKAGFFIVTTDQNQLTYENRQFFLLYGSVKLARENDMHLHTQWELEFNIAPNAYGKRADLFKKPFEAALVNTDEDEYNLGYWNPLFLPADNTDKIISYSVPLLDGAGKPYGVCGLGISKAAVEDILEQVSSPEYKRKVLLFSTQNEDDINMDNALICGNNSSWLENSLSNQLHITPVLENSEKLTDYYFNTPSGDGILGCNVKARLYPGESVFRNENWTIALLLPKSDVTAKSTRLYYAVLQLILLFIASIFITLFTSKFCIHPVLDAIKKLKDNDMQEDTNIIEIDDLIQFLRERHEAPPCRKQYAQLLLSGQSGYAADTGCITHNESDCTASESELPLLTREQYMQFEERLMSLSKAERRIFDLYMEGHNAKEICNMVYISINTLKTHNRRIYTKMNVSSRAELLKYCNELMLNPKDAGFAHTDIKA